MKQICVKLKKAGESTIHRPEYIRIFQKQADGLTYEEGLKKAEQEGFVLSSNLTLAAKAACGRGQAIGTGTIVGFEDVGKPFGEVIARKYKDCWYAFPVPKEYWGQVGAILAVNHPNFKIVSDGNTKIIDAVPGSIGIVQDFPPRTSETRPDSIISYDLHFSGDPIFGIPFRQSLSYPWGWSSIEFHRPYHASVGPIFRMFMHMDFGDSWSVTCNLFVDATREDMQFGPYAESLHITVKPTELVLDGSSELVRSTLRLLVESRTCEVNEVPTSNGQQGSQLKLTINGSPELLESTLGLLRAARKCEIEDKKYKKVKTDT